MNRNKANMAQPEEEGMRPPAFPEASLKAARDIRKEGPGTPDPTEWTFRPQLAKPLRSLAGLTALQIKPEREQDQYPCPLEPSSIGAGRKDTGVKYVNILLNNIYYIYVCIYTHPRTHMCKLHVHMRARIPVYVYI